MAGNWKKSTGKGSKGKIRVLDDATHRIKEAKLEQDVITAAIQWQEAVVGSPDCDSKMERMFTKVILLKAWRTTKGQPKNIKIPKKAVRPYQDPNGHRGQRPMEAGLSEFPD